VSAPTVAIRPLDRPDIPALLDVWTRQRERAIPADGRDSPTRPLVESRATVEQRLHALCDTDQERTHALVAVRAATVVSYLIGREVRLRRDSSYRAYAPDHFLSVGYDDWGVADPADGDLLAALYTGLATWGLARGAAAQQIAIATADDCADLWLDLGFARQDRYAFLPLAAARPAPPGVVVRRAGPGDLERATAHLLAESKHHHAAPIFAFAPPGLAEAKHREMRSSLGDPEAFVGVAELAGRAVGGISASFVPRLPGWMPSVTPTPCAYIDSAFVAPAARGQGVLRALVAALGAWAAPRNARGLFVTYLPANRDATRAWGRLGCQPLLTIHQRRLDPRAVRQLRDIEG